MFEGWDYIHDAKSGSVCSLVSQNVYLLCVNVWVLKNFDLSLWGDHANNGSKFWIKMTPIIRDATDPELRPQQKRLRVSDWNWAVKILLDLTQSSVKLQRITGTKRKVGMRGNSVKTFWSIATNTGRYWFDYFMTLRSGNTTERCGCYTPIGISFLIALCVDSWAERQESVSEISFSSIETEATYG